MDKVFINDLMDNFSKSNIYKLKIIYDNFQIELEKETSNKNYDLDENTSLNENTLALEDNQPISEVIHKNEKIRKDIEIVKSPVVGTFYSSTSPGLKPFVELGNSVLKGQTLCVVEAMKVMNEIKSPCDGIIEEIYVDDGDILEFDLPIFAIHK
ncbi:MAG: hypothetical protein FWC47_14650 [Oscillospiraceae bacterium]|nr:hypothetical protein [Oscillospiraceae bacterium]